MHQLFWLRWVVLGIVLIFGVSACKSSSAPRQADSMSETPATPTDSDGDGIPDNEDAFPNNNEETADRDGDGTGDNADCDDDNARAYPGATEICNDGIDQDCNGTDETCPSSGTNNNEIPSSGSNPNSGTTSGSGTTSSSGGSSEPPPASTPPSDRDGDGTPDSEDAFPDDPTETSDQDNDGTGDNADCDDTSTTIHPGATETCGDGIDQDCSGADETCPSSGGTPATDTDGDGTPDTQDAFPNDPTETADQDGDGSGDNADCDDTSATIYPGATDTCGDGIDQDCSGADETCPSSGGTPATDTDGDGTPDTQDAFPNDPTETADQDGDGSGDNADCNDTSTTIHPGATEICGDGIDNDCSGGDASCSGGSSLVDSDGDGFSLSIDCDDTDDGIYPDAFDEIADDLDSDCDGIGDAATPELIAAAAGSQYGDGNSATEAPLNYPKGIAIDTSGNIYIADTSHYLVRKVDPSGIITTVAGNGKSGYSGDGGPATSASLTVPSAMAFDSAGNLYIADTYNNRIRKVDQAGIITTVVGDGDYMLEGDGGLATAASINSPASMAFDSTGNLYIADTYNHAVRRVNTSGIITTVAGTGEYGYNGDDQLAINAQLNYPYYIALDATDTLYIADGENYRVRKVDKTSGIITTVAGNGEYGYSATDTVATATPLAIPTGIAFDTEGNLYIADTNNYRIRKVDPSGIINTVVGNGEYGYNGDGNFAADTSFSYIYGITFDNRNELYIADVYNKRIRKMDDTGIITTIAGTGESNYGGDNGDATLASLGHPLRSATDSAGNLYVADYDNSRVRRVDGSDIITTVVGTGDYGFLGDGGLATEALIDSPSGLRFDNDGNLYVADTYNNRVRKIDKNTGIITTVAGNGYYGYLADNVLATTTFLASPANIALDSANNLYIADKGNHRIRKVDGDGIITTVAGTGEYGYNGDNMPATSALLDSPTDIAVDSMDNLYIVDSTNGRIRKVDTNGIITTVAGASDSTTLYGYTGDGGPATDALLNYPFGVDVDRIGNIYIADTYNQCIRKVDTAGIISTVVGTGRVGGYGGDGGPADESLLYYPYGVDVDNAGNLYITDSSNNRIRKVDP